MQHRQEFVIGGWTDPKASRTGIGALLLGVYEGGKLRYAGNVGSGFDSKTLSSTRAKLDVLAADASPFAKGDAIAGKPHWVEPRLVAEVTFGEWTSSGHVRHSVFHGLRLDKDPKTIVREKASPAPRGAKAQSPAKAAPKAAAAAREEPVSHALNTKLKITNPERVIDVSTGITKIELIRYYGLVGKLMMEHLKNRPVSLVRAPAGVGGQLFFQKHAEVEKLPGISKLDQALDPEHPPMLEVATSDGLLSAAQWNVVEVHTQNATAKDYERPDRVVFDLDPGEGVDWAMIQQAAELMKSFLEDLGLSAFLKTSGGKGLHVVVPLEAEGKLGPVQSFHQGGRRAHVEDDPADVRRQGRRQEPSGQDLHRLAAQRPRIHDGLRLVGALAPRAGHLGPRRLVGARPSARRRPLDDPLRTEPPRRRQRPLAGLCEGGQDSRRCCQRRWASRFDDGRRPNSPSPGRGFAVGAAAGHKSAMSSQDEAAVAWPGPRLNRTSAPLACGRPSSTKTSWRTRF